MSAQKIKSEWKMHAVQLVAVKDQFTDLHAEHIQRVYSVLMDPLLVFQVLMQAFPKQYKWSNEAKKLLATLQWDKQRKVVKRPIYDPYDELEFELSDKK